MREHPAVAWKTTWVCLMVVYLLWVDLAKLPAFLFISQMVSALGGKKICQGSCGLLLFLLQNSLWCFSVCWWNKEWWLFAEGRVIIDLQRWSIFDVSLNSLTFLSIVAFTMDDDKTPIAEYFQRNAAYNVLFFTDPEWWCIAQSIISCCPCWLSASKLLREASSKGLKHFHNKQKHISRVNISLLHHHPWGNAEQAAAKNTSKEIYRLSETEHLDNKDTFMIKPGVCWSNCMCVSLELYTATHLFILCVSLISQLISICVCVCEWVSPLK